MGGSDSLSAAILAFGRTLRRRRRRRRTGGRSGTSTPDGARACSRRAPIAGRVNRRMRWSRRRCERRRGERIEGRGDAAARFAVPGANALAEAATFVTWTGYLLGRWNVNDPMLMPWTATSRACFPRN